MSRSLTCRLLQMVTKTFKRTVREIALAYGFRSGLEKKIADNLTSKGVGFSFEKTVIPYTTPATPHKYTPDFVLENGIIVESKGRFLPADRKKHLLVKAQHPEHDIRFVFSNSKTKISKASKTSYGDWCSKYGYLFADKDIPDAWLKEEKK
jgi:hypothetical protein